MNENNPNMSVRSTYEEMIGLNQPQLRINGFDICGEKMPSDQFYKLVDRGGRIEFSQGDEIKGIDAEEME